MRRKDILIEVNCVIAACLNVQIQLFMKQENTCGSKWCYYRREASAKTFSDIAVHCFWVVVSQCIDTISLI